MKSARIRDDRFREKWIKAGAIWSQYDWTLEIGYGLIPYVKSGDNNFIPVLIKMLNKIRRLTQTEADCSLPALLIKDNTLILPNEFRILKGSKILLDKLLIKGRYAILDEPEEDADQMTIRGFWTDSEKEKASVENKLIFSPEEYIIFILCFTAYNNNLFIKN